ncbi:MAG: hypothetical protein ACLQSR_09495 [Limisphaerales bacterium]
MRKNIYKAFLLMLLAAAPGLRAQTSNTVWFVTWNGVSPDISVRNIATDGSASAIASGSAVSFVAQTNFPSFNSPYDVAVDPAMGKVYVLDNNAQGEAPEYIYSFNLIGAPAQIANSAQVIYTMPVPQADVNAKLYPRVSGLALDTVNHNLYFNQFDVTTGTNSFVGQLDLTSSSNSDVHCSVGGNPVLQTYYVGQVPGLGPIALDATNIYIGAINYQNGNGTSGVYAAPRNGSGAFSELVALSAANTSFTNGFVSGVASDPANHLVYYLTFNAGYVNFNFSTGQNALWAYDTVSHSNTQIASGYPGYPDNLAVDPANQHYYFTLGQDGTGASPTNDQAIYTGNLGSTNAPTLLYTPLLSGQDVAGFAGDVAIQGIFVESTPTLTLNPIPATATYVANGAAMTLAPDLVLADPGSTLLAEATVAIAGGGFTGDGDALTAVTNGTDIIAKYNASMGTLTLSGSDTLANYQQVLRSVAYSSTNSDPIERGEYPARTIAWTMSDGVYSNQTTATVLAILTSAAPRVNRLGITTDTSGWTVLFTGSPGQGYVVQFAGALSGPWNDLSPLLPANPDGLIAYSDQTFPLPLVRFYRVRTGP